MSMKKIEKYRHLAHKAQSCLTLLLPDMRICFNFSTVCNDTLVAKGLNMKVLGIVIESSVRNIVRIDYRQFSFMAGRQHNGCNFHSSSTVRGILCRKTFHKHFMRHSECPWSWKSHG